ncbi:MAG: hypothetical protein AAGH57_06490 [Pseudomonadota bacterium]
MKTALFVSLAALASTTAALAQDADITTDTDVVDVDERTKVIIEDSFDDNRDYEFNDSFDDNSDNLGLSVGSDKQHIFNNSAIVAETTLSNVVTGIVVDFTDLSDSARVVNSLKNSGNAFRNYAGMNALNQNTGVGANQNAAVTIAVSGDNFGANGSN